jgi:hypothetical protein
MPRGCMGMAGNLVQMLFSAGKLVWRALHWQCSLWLRVNIQFGRETAECSHDL